MENKNIKNNLFYYATKELSQDAFIAWLCANSNNENDKTLSDISKKFILFLADKQDNNGDVSDVIVKKQHKNIDVLVEYKLDGKQKILVVEDKTYTKEHSNQLEKYKAIIQKEFENKLDGDDFSFVYYKTGHILKTPVERNLKIENHCEEENVKNCGFRIISLKEIFDFFSKFFAEPNQNEIFINYVDYIKKLHNDFNDLNVPKDSDYELKQLVNLWLAVFDSTLAGMKVNSEFRELKFSLCNVSGNYVSFFVRGKENAPYFEIRSRDPDKVFFYYEKPKNKKPSKADEYFLDEYKKFESFKKVNGKGKVYRQLFTFEDKSPKRTKSQFKEFVENVARKYKTLLEKV